MKKTFRLILIFTLFLLTSCASPVQAQMSSSTNGLQITDLKISIGAAEGKTDIQKVSYEVTIHNASSGAIDLKWLEPVLEDSVSSRALDQNLQVTVDQTIAPDSELVINGMFKFNTNGLTKNDMADWHFIYQIKLSSEQTIPVPLGIIKKP
jgi:hypothetical protein